MMIELGGNPPFGNPSGRAPRKKGERGRKLEAPNAYVLPEDDVHPGKKTRRANARAKKAG